MRAQLERGALSAASLSKIHSRVRFPDLAAYSATHTPSPPRGRGRAGAGEGGGRGGEEGLERAAFVPSFLSRRIFEANEALEEVPELAAVWEWVEMVRERRGLANRPENVDLGNAVALLDVMGVVMGDVEGEAVGDEEGERMGAPWRVARPVRPLEAGGGAEEENVRALCEALARYPWVHPETGESVPAIRFDKVRDRRALAGFVLFAAVTGPDSSRFVDEIEGLSAEAQVLIDGLVVRAMKNLGMTRDGVLKGKGGREGGEEQAGEDLLGDARNSGNDGDDDGRHSGGCGEGLAPSSPGRSHDVTHWEEPVCGDDQPGDADVVAESSVVSLDSARSVDGVAPHAQSSRALSRELSRLQDELAQSQRNASEWEGRCGELERLVEEYCAETDALRAQLQAATHAPQTPRSRAAAKAGAKAIRGEGSGGSNGERRQVVLLRKRVLDAEKRAEMLEKRLLHAERVPGAGVAAAVAGGRHLRRS